MIDAMFDYLIASWVVVMFVIAVAGQGWLLFHGLKHIISLLRDWINPPITIKRFDRDDNDYEQY